MKASSQLPDQATLAWGKTLPTSTGWGPQSWSGFGGKRIVPLPCCKLNPGQPTHSLVTTIIKHLNLLLKKKKKRQG